ncbi:ABC transporter substrate-binding protein [Roseateles sp. P5_E7]
MSASAARTFFAALLALAAALPCGATELRLAVSRGPVSLPLYVAEAKGYFSAEGLAVRMLACNSGRECFQQIGAGAADLATSAELIPALDNLQAAGPASAVVIATISTSTQQIKLVARRSAGITAPADLRGKRVGTVAHTSAQYFLDNWLLYHDVSAEQVTVVPLAVGQLVDELAAQRLDAIAIWEPIAGEAAARLGADLARLATPRVYTQHFVLAIARDKLAAREADVQRLLRGLLRAQQFIASQPGEAAKLLAERLRIAPAAALAAMGEHAYRLDLTPVLLSTMDSQSRWAIRERIVEPGSGLAPVSRAIDAGPLRKAAPGAVTLPIR